MKLYKQTEGLFWLERNLGLKQSETLHEGLVYIYMHIDDPWPYSLTLYEGLVCIYIDK